MLKSYRFLAGKCLPIFCRARLLGRFAHIQNWGDRYAGITIFFATIIANIGGPDEAPRNFPSWSTLLLKIYCRMADVNQEIRVQLVKSFLSGALRVKIPGVFKIGQSQTKSI